MEKDKKPASEETRKALFENMGKTIGQIDARYDAILPSNIYSVIINRCCKNNLF